MATDYTLDLKANLDTSEANQKLQELGATGTASFKSMESAVRNLDKQVQNLANSMKEAAKSQKEMSVNYQRLTHAGATYIGGKLLDPMARMAMESGHYNTGIALGAGSGILKGAAAGMTIGTAVGTVIPGLGNLAGAGAGMVVGGIAGGISQLKTESDKAAKSLQEMLKAHKDYVKHLESTAKTIKSLRTGVLLGKELRGVGVAEDWELEENINQARSSRTALEQLSAPGAGLKYDSMDKYLEDLNAAKEKYEHDKALADASKKELELRKRVVQELEKDEAQRQEQENKQNEALFEPLQKFMREEALETFRESLGGMKPGEARDVGKDLILLQKQLKERYKEQLESGDMAGADQTGKELEDAKTKLGMVEQALSQTPGNLAQYFGAIGTEGAKGYDTGQYGSLENAIRRQQLDYTKSIKDNVSELKSELQRVAENTTIMKDKLNDNSVAATYGGM